MKKSIITLVTILFGFYASAQEVQKSAEAEENVQDRIEQQAQPTQTQMEQNATVTAEREKREKEIMAAEKIQKSNDGKVKQKTKTVETTTMSRKETAAPK